MTAYEDGYRQAVADVTRRLLDEAAAVMFDPGRVLPGLPGSPHVAALQHAAALALAVAAPVDIDTNGVYDDACSGERPDRA